VFLVIDSLIWPPEYFHQLSFHDDNGITLFPYKIIVYHVELRRQLDSPKEPTLKLIRLHNYQHIYLLEPRIF